MVSDKKWKRQDYLSWELVEDRAVLVDPQEGKVFHFNAVGTEIWKRLDGTVTGEKVCADVAALFEGDSKKIQKEVRKFLNDLREMDLIE